MIDFDLDRAVIEKATFGDVISFDVAALRLPSHSRYNPGPDVLDVDARLVLHAPIRITTRQRMLMDIDNIPHTRRARNIYKSEYKSLAESLSDTELIESRGHIISVHCEPTQEIYDIEYTGDPEVEILSREKVKLTLKQRAELITGELPVILMAISHKNTPFPAKLLAWLAVAYALSPIDLVPDFIPVIGYLDDIVILSALISLAVGVIPDEIMQECRTQAENDRRTGEKKWVYAVPTIIIWMIILMIIIGIVINAG